MPNRISFLGLAVLMTCVALGATILFSVLHMVFRAVEAGIVLAVMVWLYAMAKRRLGRGRTMATRFR